MEKRGLSNVVVVILLVLLSFAAVSIIWGFILPVFLSPESNVDFDALRVDFEIVSTTTLTPGQQQVKVIVKRNPGGGTVAEYSLILEDSEGDSCIKQVSNPINELESHSVDVIFTDCQNLNFDKNAIKRIYVIPQIRNDAGEMITGTQSEVYEVPQFLPGSGTIPPSGPTCSASDGCKSGCTPCDPDCTSCITSPPPPVSTCNAGDGCASCTPCDLDCTSCAPCLQVTLDILAAVEFSNEFDVLVKRIDTSGPIINTLTFTTSSPFSSTVPASTLSDSSGTPKSEAFNDVVSGSQGDTVTIKPTLSDGTICPVADSYDSTTPGCVNYVDCNDNNACTTNSCDTATGTCKYPPIICPSDNNDCTTDSCNPMTGSCPYTNVADGTSCNSGTGTCSGGSCLPLASSIVAWYKLDGDATDSSGNNFQGTAIGNVLYVPGKKGQAASFSGTDGLVGYIAIDGNPLMAGTQLVTSGNRFDFTGKSYSIAAWVQRDSSAAEFRGIALFDDTGNHITGLTNNNAGNNRKFTTYFYSSIINAIRCDTTIPIASTWYHIVTTYEKPPINKLSIYVNGNLCNSMTTPTSTYSLVGDQINIGTKKANTVLDEWAGLIDEVYFFDKALSPTEVQALYSAP